MSWSVEFYQKENGEIPVLEFMLSLDAKMRAKVQQTIAKWIQKEDDENTCQ